MNLFSVCCLDGCQGSTVAHGDTDHLLDQAELYMLCLKSLNGGITHILIKLPNYWKMIIKFLIICSRKYFVKFILLEDVHQ